MATVVAACDGGRASSPAIGPKSSPTTIDEWFATLDVDIADSELTPRALDLMRATRMGGWQVESE